MSRVYTMGSLTLKGDDDEMTTKCVFDGETFVDRNGYKMVLSDDPVFSNRVKLEVFDRKDELEIDLSIDADALLEAAKILRYGGRPE